MSLSDREPPGSDLPTYRLEYLVDDTRDPEEVTIIDRNTDDISTAWISADYEAAIPAGEWR